MPLLLDIFVQEGVFAIQIQDDEIKLKSSRKRYSKGRFNGNDDLLDNISVREGNTMEIFQVYRLKFMLQYHILKVFPFYFFQLIVVSYNFDVPACNIKVYSSLIRFHSVPKRDDDLTSS